MVERFKPNNGNGQNGKSNGNAVEARGRGRPSKYQSSFPQQAAKLCKLGATDAELADFFEIEITTLYRWYCSKPEFRNSIKMPKDEADDKVERALYMKANGFWIDTEKVFCTDGIVTRVPTRDYYPPDTAAAFIWLKNRRPDRWRDKHEIDGAIRSEHIFTFNIFENDLSASMKTIEGKKSVPRLERQP